MDQNFAERLSERIRDVGPLCVGIDPSRRLLSAWGRDNDEVGLEYAALTMLHAAIGAAAAVKPQVAYFERFGSVGFRVLERLISEARDAEILVVADAKRGDIDSTNDGYAEAWMDPHSPLAADAVTVHPYLGFGALHPFIERTRHSGRGVFVVVASSNEEGREIQHATTANGELVEDALLRAIAEVNESADGLGGVGAVVGATRGRPHFALEQLRGPYLVPGVGAQGASAEHVARLFERCPTGSVLANVARAIGDAGPEPRALRDAVQRWRDDLVAALAI